MKYHSFYFYVISLFFITFFSSCGSKRDIVYFQGLEKVPTGLYQQDKANNKTVIMPNDNLFITVSASNLEAVNVFNTINLNRGSLTTSSLDLLGYLVDINGNINFPLVGELHVAGLTKTEAVALLQKKVAAYVENAIVNIRFLNYKISVLGEVNRPGVYSVTDEKISIPQAVALAGDLTIYGERRNIELIRVENGENQVYLIDLTSPELFFSPFYYLQQNDILYISPNGTKAGSSTYNQNLPLLVSLISVTITAIALFLRK
jgi:polysaccharide export outer membrane protein